MSKLILRLTHFSFYHLPLWLSCKICNVVVVCLATYVESRIGSFLGSQPNNLPTEKSAAAFKKDSAAKPANSFPSMEDQLKDLLKGNSEESLIAPGHNSTRFHLDYTNAGDRRHTYFLGKGERK